MLRNEAQILLQEQLVAPTPHTQRILPDLGFEVIPLSSMHAALLWYSSHRTVPNFAMERMVVATTCSRNAAPPGSRQAAQTSSLREISDSCHVYAFACKSPILMEW